MTEIGVPEPGPDGLVAVLPALRFGTEQTDPGPAVDRLLTRLDP